MSMDEWSVEKATGIATLGMIAFVLCVFALIGAFLNPYTINTWLEYAGKEPSMVWWQGALLGFCPIVGQLTIPAAIATWILMMFI